MECEKTWQFNVNQVLDGKYNNYTAAAEFWWALKLTLFGFAQNPWTPWGGGDGSGAPGVDGVNYSNGDGRDWLPDKSWLYQNRYYNWFVWQSPNGGQLLLKKTYHGVTADCTVVWSPGGKFGAAAGGTDGNSSDRPTAPDEWVIGTNSVPPTGLGNTGHGAFVLHVMHSTDGECTRLALHINNDIKSIWLIESLKNPVAPVLQLFWFADHSTLSQHDPDDAAHLIDYPKGDLTFESGAHGPVLLTCERFGGDIGPYRTPVADEQTGEWPLWEVGVASTSLGIRGARKGVMYDLWFGSAACYDGDTFPLDGSRQFAKLGALVFPWNGSAVVRA